MTVVDVGNRCIGLFKSGVPDQLLQAIAFAAVVFCVDDHTKPILEGQFLHFWICELDSEGIRHRCHVDLNEFIDCALVSHYSYLRNVRHLE